MTKPRAGALAACPDARRSKPVREIDGHAVVDIDTYVPYFLSAVNNALSRGASQLYLKRFGIGIVEWRTISMLAIEPRIPASRVCDVIALDKAATSRALAKLDQLGYVASEQTGADSRRRRWRLNARGRRLHDRILALALERERRLIQDVDPDDLEAFLRVMRVMRRNVDALRDGPNGA